jgi:hypothetical protein
MSFGRKLLPASQQAHHSSQKKRSHSVKLKGPGAFEEDNKQVLSILADLLSGTLGWTWISK